MATIPGAMLLCASSPYAQRGALFDAWKKHYAKESPILVWQAPTRTMNSSVQLSFHCEEYLTSVREQLPRQIMTHNYIRTSSCCGFKIS
jgi:hypothetical protein